MRVFDWFQRRTVFFRDFLRLPQMLETQMLLHGRVLSEHVKSKNEIKTLSEVEFKVFSQFGDDGIIQWLIGHIEISHRTFIEFGVGDYRESNTRFLLMNDDWSGFVMDGSERNIARLVNSPFFWKYALQAKSVFIDQGNINSLLAAGPFQGEIGLLHIDLDGVDYWIWREIKTVSPIILILEFNSLFGKDRTITVPYDRNFNRTKAHSSNLYWGASLRALQQLSANKGYALIGCNSAGNNAYFVRTDKLNSIVKDVSVESAFVESRYRESRDRHGRLIYLMGEDRRAVIQGMPVYNILTEQIEIF